MTHPRAAAFLGSSVVALMGAIGCATQSDSGSGLATVGRATTAADTRVLGFETPVADWHSSAAITTASVVYSGSGAMALAANGWTEAHSSPISSLGAAKSTAKLAVRIPQAAAWGDVRLIVTVPSLGIYWRDQRRARERRLLGATRCRGPAEVFERAGAGAALTVKEQARTTFVEMARRWSNVQLLLVRQPCLGTDDAIAAHQAAFPPSGACSLRTPCMSPDGRPLTKR
jgi:hypothetical protein